MTCQQQIPTLTEGVFSMFFSPQYYETWSDNYFFHRFMLCNRVSELNGRKVNDTELIKHKVLIKML